MLSNSGAEEDSWESLGQQGDQTSQTSPEYSLEELLLKLQYFGHLMRSWLIGKDPDDGKDWGQEEKEATEDEMVR